MRELEKKAVKKKVNFFFYHSLLEEFFLIVERFGYIRIFIKIAQFSNILKTRRSLDFRTKIINI